MRISCFGDSITFGEFVLRRDTWVYRLSREFLDDDVVNLGVCYETSRLALERAARDIGRNVPDILLIQFGLNDANIWDTEHGLSRVLSFAYSSNLHELASRAHSWGVEKNRIFILGPTSTQKPSLEFLAPEYEEAAALAARLAGATFVPLRDVGTHEDDLLPDGVHLSVLGHGRYLKRILLFLRSLRDS